MPHLRASRLGLGPGLDLNFLRRRLRVSLARLQHLPQPSLHRTNNKSPLSYPHIIFAEIFGAFADVSIALRRQNGFSSGVGRRNRIAEERRE